MTEASRATSIASASAPVSKPTTLRVCVAYTVWLGVTRGGWVCGAVQRHWGGRGRPHRPTTTATTATTTKNESPKPSPAERLGRKRAAARLRQQRCRARKRQAMLDKKRGEVDVVRQLQRPTHTHDLPTRMNIPASSANSVMHVPTLPPHHRSQSSTRFPPFQHHPHSMTLMMTGPPVVDESWVRRGYHNHQQKISSSPEHTHHRPIYNCVSFDSQKSFEDAHHRSRGQQQQQPSSPPRSLEVFTEAVEMKSSILVSPTRTSPTPPPSSSLSSPTGNEQHTTSSSSTTLVRVLSDEKSEEPLVQEEEAFAIAAMLSLKSGSKALVSSTTRTIKCDDHDDDDECVNNATTSTTNDIKQTPSSSSSLSSSQSSEEEVNVSHSKQLHQHQHQQHQQHHQNSHHQNEQQPLIQHQQSQQQQRQQSATDPSPRGLYEAAAYHNHRSRTTAQIPAGARYYRMHHAQQRPPMPLSHHYQQHLQHPHHPHHYSRGGAGGVYYPPTQPRYAVAYD